MQRRCPALCGSSFLWKSSVKPRDSSKMWPLRRVIVSLRGYVSRCPSSSRAEDRSTTGGTIARKGLFPVRHMAGVARGLAGAVYASYRPHGTQKLILFTLPRTSVPQSWAFGTSLDNARLSERTSQAIRGSRLRVTKSPRDPCPRRQPVFAQILAFVRQFGQAKMHASLIFI